MISDRWIRLIQGCIASVLWWVIPPHKCNKDKRIRKILVCEYYRIGDVVMAQPACDHLRKEYPDAELVLLTSELGKALVEHSEIFDQVVSFECPWVMKRMRWRAYPDCWSLIGSIRSRRFDVAIEFKGRFLDQIFLYLTGAWERVSISHPKGSKLITHELHPSDASVHRQIRNNQVVGTITNYEPKEKANLVIQGECFEKWTEWINELHGDNSSPVIVIHPGAGNPLRQWRYDRFASVVKYLRSKWRANVIVLAGPNEEEIGHSINRELEEAVPILCIGISDAVHIIAAADVFIGHDTGTAHIAAAVNTKSIILFGPAEPSTCQPIGENVQIVIARGIPCRPCSQKICLRPFDFCMDKIHVDSVIQYVDEMLT